MQQLKRLLEKAQNGDMDAFVGNNNAADKLWLNDGTGHFTSNGQQLDFSASELPEPLEWAI